MRALGSLTAMAALLGLTTFALPRPAQACGGTFCDAGPGSTDPQSMPVDQTGETIVFVLDETHVEAHIQIEYDPSTDAQRFAWIVPVFGEPEFSVSSQQLLLNLQNSTVPSYGYTNQFESCGGGDEWDGWDGGDWDGCDGGNGAADTGGGWGDEPGGDDGETTGGGTEVLQSETIGAFDIVVLQSQTADDLMTWLGDNGYFQDPAAAPILQEYIDEGAHFAAVRLQNGADVGEIHPIALRYEGHEPCVPIRLTRIAAKDDMAIRVFFLASERVYPTNYRHVELNPLKLSWTGLGSNYDEVVTRAIDEPGVDGRGFVTEYSGPTELVSREGLFSEAWQHDPFRTVAATEVGTLLLEQGLLDCRNGAVCTGHPLVLGLLADYLPVPEGLTPAEYYRCIECYSDARDLTSWDGNAFARDLEVRVIAPGRRAVALLDGSPRLTRMYTTLSPHEMTVDPMFHLGQWPSERVDLTTANATRFFPCGGRTEMRLPSGHDVQLVAFDQWPEIAPDRMPWAERITEHLPGVAPVVLVDNRSLIDELLAAWNSSMRSSAVCHDSEQDSLGSGGCGCRTDREGRPASLLLVLLAGLGLRRLRGSGRRPR